MSSRLFDEIREQRGLAYAVYSAPSAYADAGALAIYAGATPAHVDPVLDLIEVELKKLVAAGLSDDELAVAKGYLTGSYVLSLEDPSSRMKNRSGTAARSKARSTHRTVAGVPPASRSSQRRPRSPYHRPRR